MFTISSTANNSIHQFHSFNSENKNNNHFYDPTFSPYLSGNEGTIVGRLGEPSQNLSPFNSKNRKSPLQKLEKKEENGEIGVFGAEKYFNEGEVLETPRSSSIATPKYLHQRDEQMTLATRKHTLQYGTPSIRSESTSNSQSALLKSGMRNPSRDRKDNKGQAKSVLAGLGFKCSCSGKDSVDAGEISFRKTATYGAIHGKTTRRKLVDIAALDASHSIKISKPNAELLKINNVYFQKQESFGVGLNSQKSSLAFSPLSSTSGSQNHLVKMQLQLDEEEKPRKSLEVFGSPLLNKKIKSLSFDRRLVKPSRDGTQEIDSNSNYNINDAASDASSDLFEIESIKSKTNPFLARQTSDAASTCASPANGYAPSEASIEWSVATASAAVMSDCEEQMSELTIRSPIRTSYTPSNGKPKSTREVHRRRPSMLLGCKSHKSVRVAGDAFITYENPSSTPKVRSRTSSSQVARFPSETKLGDFGAKHGQQQQHHHAYATPPLQHSHSPHASKLLYI